MIRALALCGFLTAAAVTPAQFALRDGDRVAFYGDSITDNGAYTAFVETYTRIRYPNLDIRFFNAGVGADKVTGGWMGPIDARLPRDLFSRKPTVVTSMLGMNDGGYVPFSEDRYATYMNGYRVILDQFRKNIPQARVWLIQPSPFDDVTRAPTVPGGYNAVLLRYGQGVAQLAKEYGHWTVDFNFPLADALFRANATDAAVASRIISDRVHPGPGGHVVMAATLLKAWNAPALGSQTAIDATSGSIASRGARIASLKRGDVLTWTQTDETLPFPIDWKDPVVQLAVKSAPVASQIFAPMTLLVTGLPAPQYVLSIDDAEVGTFSSAQLAAGLDLATLDTPMLRQAQELQMITDRRKNMIWSMWRNIEFGLQTMPSRERDAAILATRKLEDELIGRQRALARTKPRKFTLSPKA